MPDSPYTNDLEGVPPGSFLIRRINPKFCDWHELDGEGHPRITRQAVQFHRDAEAERLGRPGPDMSFVLQTSEEELEELGKRYPGYGLARISTDWIRVEGALGAQLWPTDEEASHVVVFRIDGASRLSGTQAKRLAEGLGEGWLVSPAPPQGAA